MKMRCATKLAILFFISVGHLFAELCPHVTVTAAAAPDASPYTIRKALHESALIACKSDCPLNGDKVVTAGEYTCKSLRFNEFAKTCTAIYRCLKWP